MIAQCAWIIATHVQSSIYYSRAACGVKLCKESSMAVRELILVQKVSYHCANSSTQEIYDHNIYKAVCINFASLDANAWKKCNQRRITLKTLKYCTFIKLPILLQFLWSKTVLVTSLLFEMRCIVVYLPTCSEIYYFGWGLTYPNAQMHRYLPLLRTSQNKTAVATHNRIAFMLRKALCYPS